MKRSVLFIGFGLLLLSLSSAEAYSQEAPSAAERLKQLTALELGPDLLEVHFLDVGQADSILIRTPAGQNLLIDAGTKGSNKTILPYLKTHGVTSLDAVVITHSHFDHVGGLAALLGKIPVGTIYYSGQVHETPSNTTLFRKIEKLKIPLVKVAPGFELPLKPPVKAVVLHPPKDWSLDDGTDINDTSVVIRLSLGEIDFMLMGDAEHMSESQVLSTAATVEAEVIKLGHHGSATASGERFLTRVSPVVAIVSCGSGNRYGHPHEETLDTLRSKGIKLYRTDEDGTIRVRTDGKALRIDLPGDQSLWMHAPLEGRLEVTLLRSTAPMAPALELGRPRLSAA